jgi:hypothetical protein
MCEGGGDVWKWWEGVVKGQRWSFEGWVWLGEGGMVWFVRLGEMRMRRET